MEDVTVEYIFCNKLVFIQYTEYLLLGPCASSCFSLKIFTLSELQNPFK